MTTKFSKKKILILANEALQDMVIGRNGTLAIAMSLAKKNYEIFFAREVEIGSHVDKISAQKIEFKPAIYELHSLYEKAAKNYSQEIAQFFEHGGTNIDEVAEVQHHTLGSRKDDVKISAKQKISYENFSHIINRLDPVEDIAWTKDQIEKMRVISIKNKIPLIGAANNIDKYEPLAMAENLCPQTILMSQNPSEMQMQEAKKILVRHGEIVIKPSKSGQGKGIKKISNAAEIIDAINEIKNEFHGHFLDGFIAQEMLPGALRGDVRTIFYRNKRGKFELGGHVARAQLKHGFINCVSSGRAVVVAPEAVFSKKEITDLNENSRAVLNYLNQHKSSIASPIVGADFIPKFPSKTLAQKAKGNSMFVVEMNFLCVALFNMTDVLSGKSPFAKGSITDKITEGMLRNL